MLPLDEFIIKLYELNGVKLDSLKFVLYHNNSIELRTVVLKCSFFARFFHYVEVGKRNNYKN